MSSLTDVAVKRGPYVGAALGLIAIVVLISMGVITRNVGIEIGGLQTYAQLLGIWIGFIVAGGLAMEQRHIQIDFFTDKLPERVQYIHSLIVYTLNILVCVILAYGGVAAMQRFWTGTAPNAPIPLPVYYLAVVVGAGLLGIVYCGKILGSLGIGGLSPKRNRTDEDRNDTRSGDQS